MAGPLGPALSVNAALLQTIAKRPHRARGRERGHRREDHQRQRAARVGQTDRLSLSFHSFRPLPVLQTAVAASDSARGAFPRATRLSAPRVSARQLSEQAQPARQVQLAQEAGPSS